MDALEQVMRERVVKSLCLSIITLGIQSQAYAIPAMPADANMDRLPEQVELMRRGYYIETWGSLKRLNAPDQLGCKGFEIQAHRGHPQHTENGPGAVMTGITSRFNGVEVDARQLGDGSWVFNHDATTGRTLVHRSGDVPLRSLDLNSWMTAKGRNRLGAATNEDIYGAFDILTVVNELTHPAQIINIEIKTDPGLQCGSLGSFDAGAKTLFSKGKIGYSSMDGVQPLQCIRQFNKEAYVALIQGPSQPALEKWAAANHGDELSRLKGRQRLMAGARLATQAFGAYKYPRWGTAAALTELKTKIGGDVGLHVEITDLLSDPGLTARAHKAGISKVMTYTLTDNESHIEGLKQLKARGAMPDGAIVDSTPIKTCKMLGLE